MIKYNRIVNVLYHHTVVINDDHTLRFIEKFLAFHKVGRMRIYYNYQRSLRHHVQRFFFRNKNVGILGNGDYALHEAKILEPLAKAVTIFTNGLTETFDSSVLGNIQVNHKKLLSVGGENSLEWITFEDGSKLNIDGLFVALGSAGSTDIAKKLGLILKDNHIMIETDTSTMLPGFFAAGDCTGGMMQIAKAVYEGAQAGTKAVKFIKNTK